jgi:amino acid adenylation domain-containing protein
LTNPDVLQAIVDRADLDPHHLAAKDLDRELSYAELIEEVTRVGIGMRARGVLEGDRVALLIPNSVDFVVAALACLRIGAVFVPLAVTDPRFRLESVVANCEPTLVVRSANVDAELATSLDARSVTIDLLREEGRASMDHIEARTRVAYIIYTSGTTGTPKGVQIGNAAFAAAVYSTLSSLGLDSTTRTLCVSPFHFDGSYANLFPTLVAGGTAVIRPRDALLYPRTFFSTVAQEQINYSGFTPSYLRLLLGSRQTSDLKNSTLKMIALGGEAPSVSDLRFLWSLAPSIRVFNRYGPTECTIAVTNVELTPELIEGGSVPIGRPHQGVSFVLVDDEGRVVNEVDRTGELYIGGVQLMSGYWADPALTREVMREDIVENQTLYRTGDLVYRDEHDNYVYVDRADRVIKRSGVRISLVELSALMNALDDVDSAACVTFDHEGDLGIVAFVTTKRELSAMELRRAARELIPENMLPDRIETVVSMPMNRSNQLDENQLLSLAALQPYLGSGANSATTKEP